MICNADVKSLEVVVAAELSGDEVLIKEINDKVDIHDVNRERFNLGEGKEARRVAKVFKFRLIYGGMFFHNDPDFRHVSTKKAFWDGVVEQYFDKYKGMRRWHTELIQTAQRDGKLTIPSGRFYPFSPLPNGEWPITQIKNYPVQGFGADLVMLARLETRRRIRESGLPILLVSTIHDSIVVECPEKHVQEAGKILFESIEAVPRLCKQVFGYDFRLPMTSEVQYGPNKKNLVDLVL